jgi:hypothetical protein
VCGIQWGGGSCWPCVTEAKQFTQTDTDTDTHTHTHLKPSLQVMQDNHHKGRNQTLLWGCCIYTHTHTYTHTHLHTYIHKNTRTHTAGLCTSNPPTPPPHTHTYPIFCYPPHTKKIASRVVDFCTSLGSSSFASVVSAAETAATYSNLG